jgi:hypothetical protein
MKFKKRKRRNMKILLKNNTEIFTILKRAKERVFVYGKSPMQGKDGFQDSFC